MKILKSNFARYILTFDLLILLSFSAIASIISYVMIHYSHNNKQELTNKLVDIIFDDIESYLEEENASFSYAIARFNSEIAYSDKFAKMLDATFFITDKNGTVLYASGDLEHLNLPHKLSDNIVTAFSNTPGESHYNDLGGVLPEKYFNTAFVLYDSSSSDTVNTDPLGIIFVCTPTSGIDQSVQYILITVLIALLWVFAAAFTSLYFISKRLNKPILILQQKLKAFSKGDFTVRMNLTGVTEIDNIAASFNEMAESIEKNEISRRSFVSNVSHDLRTPMTSIQGFIDAILDGTIPPEKQKYYLSIVSKEIKRLSRLVTSLLHVSRIEAGKDNPELNKTSFDLCEMTRLIIISFEERLLQKNVEFHLDAENDRSFVYADKDSIYQVMYNLLENAVKFVNEGGIIRVTVTRSPVLENKKYNISVYNTGIGIRENDRKNIFDRFYKVDFSRNEDKSGVGLGLFIVKTKLDAHGETIAVSGEYGKYCVFEFSLQRSDSPHGEVSRGDTDAITASPLISESRLPGSTHTDAQTSHAPSPANDGQKADADTNNPTDHTDNTEFTENTDNTNNTDNTDNTDNTERN